MTGKGAEYLELCAADLSNDHNHDPRMVEYMRSQSVLGSQQLSQHITKVLEVLKHGQDHQVTFNASVKGVLEKMQVSPLKVLTCRQHALISNNLLQVQMNKQEEMSKRMNDPYIRTAVPWKSFKFGCKILEDEELTPYIKQVEVDIGMNFKRSSSSEKGIDKILEELAKKHIDVFWQKNVSDRFYKP